MLLIALTLKELVRLVVAMFEQRCEWKMWDLDWGFADVFEDLLEDVIPELTYLFGDDCDGQARHNIIG